MPKITIPTDERGYPTGVFLDGEPLPCVERIVLEAGPDDTIKAHIKVGSVMLENLKIDGSKLLLDYAGRVFESRIETTENEEPETQE